MRRKRYSPAYLANLLIDGIRDKNINFVEHLIKRYGADPNQKIELGYTPMHFCAGFEDPLIALQVMNLFLAYDGDPNISTEVERYTPLHIACLNSHKEVARVLIDNGANIYAKDAENNMPIHYATIENCMKIVTLIRNEIYRDKQRKRHALKIQTANATTSKVIRNGTPTTLLQAVQLNNELMASTGSPASSEITKNSTPSRIIYNFDRTSPYYINITHRRKISATPASQDEIKSTTPLSSPDTEFEIRSTGETMDIFELTEENLAKYSTKVRESGQFDLIDKWRSKVNSSLQRRSFLNEINDLADLLGSPPNPYDLNAAMTDDSYVTAPALIDNAQPNTPVKTATHSISPTATLVPEPKDDGQLSVISTTTYIVPKNQRINQEHLKPPEIVIDQDDDNREAIISPRKENVLLHWIEEYKHTDGEGDIQFKEVKILPALEDVSDRRARSTSPISDSFRLDTDYDTDVLREQLTQFGDAPGPITKNTKKLYLKRLVKYQRNPQQVKALHDRKKEARIYSLELEKALKQIDTGTEFFAELLQLEADMVRHFRQMKSRNQREGKQKMSFIYLLLDPLELDNLAINHSAMGRSEVWQRFLKAIFYVGKGKRHRPYAHLYEAMRYFASEVQSKKLSAFVKKKDQSTCAGKNAATTAIVDDTATCIRSIAELAPNACAENQKLNRILSIWKEKKGVVCLHIFHSIIPVEAYTREAAIIDAIGLSNLTNVKRGDYYGATTSWSMRQRKQLGVALLYKALNIHLLEGESQLLPNDLF